MAFSTTNTLGGPVEALRALIAASATFQALVGVDGEDSPAVEALAHIYCPAIIAADAAAAGQFALILGHLDVNARGKGSGAVSAGGSMGFGLEADVPAGHAGETTAKLAAAEEWFLDLLGDILGEMVTASASGGLLLRGWRLTEPIQRSDVQNDEGDHYLALLEIDWGAG